MATENRQGINHLMKCDYLKCDLLVRKVSTVEVEMDDEVNVELSWGRQMKLTIIKRVACRAPAIDNFSLPRPQLPAANHNGG